MDPYTIILLGGTGAIWVGMLTVFARFAKHNVR
jgi:hypothetical protein